MDTAQQPYLLPEYERYGPLISPEVERRRELSSGRVLFHLILFGCTAISTTITGGAFYIQAADESLNGPLDALFAFFRETATGNIDPLSNGLLFTFTLLIILAAHEFGHYFACRHYGIRATLPFFLPAPPLLTLLGTFGAVIKIKEPIRSRKALFDIGIAGPLAGFVFALPASLVGLMFASPAPPATGRGLINDPPLFVLINILFGVPKFIQWNPIYWAAWGTVLITSLNLFPVGQLDGGHVMYAVLGPRWHKRITIAVCVAVASLATYTLVAHQPPVYLLWTVVLLFLARVGHPPVEDQQPLGKTRLALAALALIVFLLCFMPFPISDS